MDGVTGALTTLQAQLTALAVPLGIIGIISFILAFLISPFLPDALGNMRGYIQRALIGIAFISFVPAIVRGLASLSGGS
jgi:hypothetical protein